MDDLTLLRWLQKTTGEKTGRAIAAKIGVSHTTVQRWLSKGAPPRTVLELSIRFRGDPMEAAVMSGLVCNSEVASLNYAELAKYIPVEILAAELARRASTYAREREDPLRKTAVH